MEDLLRMLTCPCRTSDGKVACRCPELAPGFRCSCAHCISQRIARIEDMDLPFEKCKYEQSMTDNADQVQAGISKMLGVPVANKMICILRNGHVGKHQVVPVT